MLIPDRRQFRPEFFRAIADSALIELETRLSGSLATDSPALPLAAAAGFPQPGREIIEPRDLHLQPGRSRSRVPAENLNDDPGPIEHRHPSGTFQVFQLGRRQITVHDDDLRLFARAGGSLDAIVRFVVV